MSYIRLIMSLSFFMLSPIAYPMELNLKCEPSSHKKDHKKNLLSLFTQSDAEPTHSSQIKTNHRTLPIVSDNTNKISPRKLDTTENNRKSPKHSPRKPSPRKKLDISDESPQVSPKVSPRKCTINTDHSTIEHTKQKNKSNQLILSDIPELPRGRSHSAHMADKQKDHDKSKRTIKSKSTNDKPASLTRRKSSKDVFKNQKDSISISIGTYSPEEEYKNNNPVKSLSISDSVVDNPSHPSQSNSSPSLLNDNFMSLSQSNSSSMLCNNESNSTITSSSSLTKHSKEYSFGKFFSKSSGTTDHSQRTSPIRTSKPIIKENDIISLVRSINIDTKKRSADLDILKELIDNPTININLQNKHGMTALHYATLEAKISKNENLIALLLLDPRTDSSLKNNNSQTASQLIEGSDFCDETRKLLFARLTLDETTNREMFIMLINLHIKNEPITVKCIQETAKIIKNKIRKVESSQGSSELPEEALLHAKKDFIAEMITHRIPKDTIATQILITAIHEEIRALRLNVEIDNPMITESVNTIKETFIKSNKKLKSIYPPQYTDQNFIFSVIRSYMQDQKIKTKPSFSEMIMPQDSKMIMLLDDDKI